MSKKLIAGLLAVMMVCMLVLAGCGAKNTDTAGDNTGDNKGKEKFKVGFIFIGPKNDGGWTQSHYNGMEYMKKELEAMNVDTVYKELVPEGPESKKAIMDLVDQKCKIIFTTSYGYMDPTLEVAKEFPDIKFVHCSGYKTADNMGNYFGRMYEPRYLSGIVAGLKTQADKIGYVAAFEIPEVISGINAFTLGVQSVNPDAKVVVEWTHTWIDQEKEKAAAVALLDSGCDVITLHNDSTMPQVEAEKRGKWAIGYDLDQRDAAPKAYMTAPIWNWGPYYTSQVKAAIEGTWKSEVYYGGMKDGIIDLAPLTDIAPAESKTKVEEMTAKIKDGSFFVFTGPIKNQAGNEKVKAGEKLTDADILGMMWFVQGVEGKLPESK